MEVADAHWRAAIGDSVYAPPDEGFADRLRAIAHAAIAEAAVMLEAAGVPELRWDPTPQRRETSLSYELRPDGNRPGSAELWEEYDGVVAQIADAQAGADYPPIAHGFQALADVLERLAVSVDEERNIAARQRRRRTG
jgi:hypothetical protein